ncbi:phytanoyl-CoA dioxygenase family protein [Streptomyces sp. NPDC017988]|uniref:phytanoyl-CoA dioxygenase family protein n=1 Tax=Streptomyces sp. NPDC017988 TaxID=3365025 RepID=UPI0037B3875D
MVTAQQADFFRLFGFLPLPGLFDAGELAVIEKEYAVGHAEASKVYSAALGVRGQMSWSNMRDQTPFLAGALETEKLRTAAEALLGPEAVGVMSNGNVFSGNLTEWHADTSVPGFRSLKFVAYLDPVDADSGALRVLPGSHKDPWHDELLAISVKERLNTAGNPESEESGRTGFPVDAVPARVCTSRPGDVYAFDLRTWHASLNGFPNRRMCSFTYFGAPRDGAQSAAVRSVVKQFGREAQFRELRRQRDWIAAGARPSGIPRRESQYSPGWLAGAGGNEHRARWIEQLRAWGMAPAA